MCATACPLGINTGDLVKGLRTADQGRLGQAAWRLAARHWGGTSRTLGLGLTVAKRLPPAVPGSLTRVARAMADSPQWSDDLPAGGTTRRPQPVEEPDAVFVPSCLSTMFGPAQGGVGVSNALLALAQRAGLRLLVPDGIANMCCGTPWSSKGLTAGHEAMRAKVYPVLVEASRAGELPIVVDATSCTEGFRHLFPEGQVVDAVAFVAERMLPRLTLRHRLPSLVLHPTCSSTRLGLNDSLLTVAHAVADEVVVPDGWGCCGFAGDRGLLRPELTAAATRGEAAAVAATVADAHASVNRPCEIGLTRATGHPYRHLLELLEAATHDA
jgi:D-lactate dehydrogenase